MAATAAPDGTSSISSFPALTASLCAAPSQPFYSQNSRSDSAVLSAAMQKVQHAVASAQPAVVAVLTSGGTWASGVVVSARNGYIVTNAHLLVERTASSSQSRRENAQSAQSVPPTVRVQIWPHAGGGEPESRRPVSATAVVVFVFHGALDIAVLHLESSACLQLKQVMLRDPRQTPTTAEGEPVAVVGFPLFSPRLCLGHFVTAGVVSKVPADLWLCFSPLTPWTKLK